MKQILSFFVLAAMACAVALAAGMTAGVTLTGDMKGVTITVSKITMPAK